MKSEIGKVEYFEHKDPENCIMTSFLQIVPRQGETIKIGSKYYIIRQVQYELGYSAHIKIYLDS